MSTMKILYIANHTNGQGDDEGAIHHALTELGHNVILLEEKEGHLASGIDCDLVLFHKWTDTETMKRLKAPIVFWYFDLVNYPDRTLAVRCAARLKWMSTILPLVNLGFCTDGDWCLNAGSYSSIRIEDSRKLVWLPQGADERIVGLGTKRADRLTTILFTGISAGGGTGRRDFVAQMKSTYGNRFRHFANGLYGMALADQIASSDIVVAPNAPCTNHYWSNRVYTSLGYGAFLLHPYCGGLAQQYQDGKHLVFYRDMKDLHGKIKHYCGEDLFHSYVVDPLKPSPREIAVEGLRHTLRYHTYRHRCQRLLEVVLYRLGIGS